MVKPPMQQQNNLVGIFYMVTSYVFYSMVNCIVKLLGDTISSYNIAFFRYLFSFLTIIPFLWLVEFKFKGLVKDLNIYNVLRAALSFLSMVWFAAGLANTPLNEAMALTFTTPVFMSIMAILWLKEKSTVDKWAAIFIGLIGGLIIANPHATSFNYSSLYIVGACFLWALTTIVVKILSNKQDPIVISFYMSLLTVPISLPYFLYKPYMPTAKEALLLLALGAFYNLALVTSAKAYQLIQLTVAAPFDFLRMMLGSILGCIVFDETIADKTIVGSLLIIAGSTLAVGRGIRNKLKNSIHQ